MKKRGKTMSLESSLDTSTESRKASEYIDNLTLRSVILCAGQIRSISDRPRMADSPDRPPIQPHPDSLAGVVCVLSLIHSS